MPHRIIIVEPDPIICIDLEGTLKDTFPDHEVVVASEPATATALLQGAEADTTVFVKASWLIKHDGLDEIVRQAAAVGSRIVTLGQVDGLPPSFRGVEVPFTTEMVVQAMSSDAKA